MRPLTITLTGFIGVRDGMKRESITIDFQSLPEGLIALSGPNGSGKTTIMDNMHPYRIMPSQASKLSVDSFSYWDHIYGVKAEKVLDWEHAGQRYRSTFSFRKTGKSGKADYYLTVQDADGPWSPVTLPDGRTSDGKAENYDRCLKAVCGSLEQFFTSVFSAQNRRPLASYGTGEIKSLLAELLKVDQLQALAVRAGDVAKSLQRSLDAAQQEVLLFASKRDRLSQTTKAIDQDGEALNVARRARETLASQAATLGQQRSTLAVKQAESKAVEARVRELTQRRTEVTGLITANANEEKAATGRIDQRRAAIAKGVKAFTATLAQEALIKGATARREDAQLRISRGEARAQELQTQIKALEQTPLTLKTLEAEVKSLVEQGRSKREVLSSFKQQADDFKAVPCSQMDVHRSCPLYRQAGDANARYDLQLVEIKKLRTVYDEKETQAKVLAPELAKLQTARAELEAVNAGLVQARRDLQQATELAARAPLIDQAKEGLASCQADLALLDKEVVEIVNRFLAQAAQFNAQLEQVNAEVARLGAVDLAGEIAGLDLQLQTNRDETARTDGQIEALIRSQATREAEAQAMKTELVGCDATQASASQLSDEIAKWKLLSKGLGNDGVIALTIDDAGPALTQEVNDLLLACYGMRFTVEIRTQRALANGELREGFEILVHDADSDNTKVVGVMSGGQKVWINECMTRGIALYIAHIAGQPYGTLFTDEADGPLDPEKKRQFVRMKREVLKRGGYGREFFITHTPELLEEADAVIDVAALAL
ncbi:AAA family ATPase [Paraburkholderia aromaticivorans]|uniref:AAA family ATPase n=1 Tax=Paraburkholderia aromaticivorans TaxID=2026199 RepID=UPI001455E298|nr:AAA family ATPase [Paraburkholderia aromaticivorans]